MVLFPLQIVTPDGLVYDEKAAMISVRTIEGDVGIRARHLDLVTALGMGECFIDIDEKTRRYAACMGGLLAVVGGSVRLVATTFEWAEDIDFSRADLAKIRAEEILNSNVPPEEKKIAESRLRRALVRLSMKNRTKHQADRI